MKTLILFLLTTTLSSLTYAQTLTLKGKITDELDQPIPFATIYLKNSSKGSSANSEGEFQLKLVRGNHAITFKAIGFSSQTQQLELSKDQSINIVLKAEAYQLSDVMIKAGGEDPAYAIIRKAIRRRKTYAAQKAYDVEVYMKGLQRMLKAPKKFLGSDIDKAGKEMGLDSNRQGIIYLSESESKFSFMPPAEIKEEMISSKVSGSSRAFSFNRASQMQVNLYKNYQSWEGISNRPIISPIADNALSYYQYKFLGSTFENGVEVNKIRVTPKRGNEPVFSGDLYILEDSWRIYGADLLLTKNSGLNFVDTLKIQQSFLPVNDKDWQPASTRFDFTGGFLGFEVGGYFIAVYRNYTYNLKVDKQQFKEVLRITKDVNKKDSTYWSQARPVPLTEEEQQDYTNKQALSTKKESKHYLDSLDKAHNKFKSGRVLLFGGYTYRNRSKKESYRFNSLLSSAFYNTVEGWGLDYGASYTKRTDTLDNRHVRISAKARYAFTSHRLNPSVSGNVPSKIGNIGFNVGSDMLDLNSQQAIPSLPNSINSLFYERNLLKLYQKSFAQLSLSKRLIGGVQGYMSLEWSERNQVQNSAGLRWRDVDNRAFTSNNPFTPSSEESLFRRHQALTFNFSLSYNFSNKYVTYPEGRYFLPSKYPTVSLNFRRGIKSVLKSDVDYSFLSISAGKNSIALGLYGKSDFSVSAGKFLAGSPAYFPDYKHFAGNQSRIYTSRPNSFLFLDYYTFSTNDDYIEGHLMHNFSGLVMNKIPAIRKLKLQETIGVNYLNTPLMKNYSELFLGLQFLNLNLQYGFSYRDGEKDERGLRLSYKWIF